MSRSALLRRLERLEQTANQAQRSPIRLVDLTKVPDALASFWEGDESVIPDRPDGLPDGAVHAVVIAPTLAAFEAYRETVGLDENELEAVDRQGEAEERRRTAEKREAEHRARVEAADAEQVRDDYSGYPIQ